MFSMQKEIEEQPQVLKQCFDSNQKQLNVIVKEMKKREVRFVVIAARGTSDHAATYGKYVFEILTGLPVMLAAPSVITMYKRPLKLSQSLVIGISQSGEAKDVAAVMTEAKRNGALTVGITNVFASPLAQTTDFCLYCSAGQEKSVAATKTFTTQMLLLGCLAAQFAGDTDTLAQLGTVPDLAHETIEKCGKSVKCAVERYRFMEECIILARGINYSIAMESALKIEETTYVRAKAFASSDFYHGPMAILKKDMPVLVYAPTGPSFEDETEAVKMLKTAQADVLFISNRPASCETDSQIVLPDCTNDIISPFSCAIVAQLFACNLAALKGLNPDAPHRLHKVTITV